MAQTHVAASPPSLIKMGAAGVTAAAPSLCVFVASFFVPSSFLVVATDSSEIIVTVSEVVAFPFSSPTTHSLGAHF